MFYGLSSRQKIALYLLAFIGLFVCGYVGSWYLNQPTPIVFEQKKRIRYTKQVPESPQEQHFHRENSQTQKEVQTSPSPKHSIVEPKTTSQEPQKINLNQASEEELQSLPGIGPSTATLIIEYRSAHGGFHAIDELRVVKGIGPKKFAKIQPLLTLEGEE